MYPIHMPKEHDNCQVIAQVRATVPVDNTNTPEEVIAADAIRSENILAYLDASWQAVRSVKGVCELAETTMKVMERRRKLLCQPYGAAAKDHKHTVVVPLD